jgi:hypothetical protein
MNSATTGSSVSAVCQTPGGLIAYSPGPSSCDCFVPSGQILVQGHVPLDATDDLVPGGMDFPAVPAFLEPVHRHDSAFVEVVAWRSP